MKKLLYLQIAVFTVVVTALGALQANVVTPEVRTFERIARLKRMIDQTKADLKMTQEALPKYRAAKEKEWFWQTTANKQIEITENLIESLKEQLQSLTEQLLKAEQDAAILSGD